MKHKVIDVLPSNATVQEKMDAVRIRALNRGRIIKPDPRLNKTQFRAMNPHFGKILKQPFIKNAYTYATDYYDLRTTDGKETLAMDINHEVDEEDKGKIGWGYDPAHKFANRRQRRFVVEERRKVK